jgi:deazaflavin-dependent oxidoreductase (nitroreductase family)
VADPDPNAWNNAIIEEFRANAGKVGGVFEGKPVLILHHTGAKTGEARLNPLMYQSTDGGIAIFASKGGAPRNPDWFHNLVANPLASVEVGTEIYPVRARVAEGEERDRIFTRQKEAFPQFADYEKSTTRTIPVIVLERLS